jgi:hypothetical protein
MDGIITSPAAGQKECSRYVGLRTDPGSMARHIDGLVDRRNQ